MYCLTGLDLTNHVPLEVMSTEVVHRFENDFLLHPQMLFSLCTHRKRSTSLVSLSPLMKVIPLLNYRPLLSSHVASSIFIGHIFKYNHIGDRSSTYESRRGHCSV